MPVFKKKKQEKAPPIPDPCDGPVKVLDKRVGLDCYRDFFTLKNYWKTIRRNGQDAGKNLFAMFLKANPGTKAKYAKLKNAPDDITAQCSDAGFEALSAEYLKIFDDVITVLEEQPENCSDAITRLNSVGKSNSSKD
ncbi:Globin [Aphelenchoides bicaudatus]|nr:Globin [Aphelenchoides bicaudatus]